MLSIFEADNKYLHKHAQSELKKGLLKKKNVLQGGSADTSIFDSIFKFHSRNSL